MRNIYAKYFNYNYEEESPGVKNFILKEGLILKQGKEVIIGGFHKDMPMDFLREIYLALKSVLPAYLKLEENFGKLEEECTPAVKLHTEVKWKLSCITLARIFSWYIHLYEAKMQWDQKNSEGAKASLQKAVDALQDYLDARKRAEYGDFAGWYREEIKFDTEGCLSRTVKLLDRLQA